MLNNLLNSTASITRMLHIQDEIGSSIGVPVVVYSAVPCRIEHLTFDEKVFSAQVGIESTHRIFMIPGWAIQEGDLIASNGEQFEVVHVEDIDYMGRLLEISTKQVKV